MRQAVSRAAASVERSGLTSWSFGDLPRTFEREQDGQPVKGFPALVDEGTTVAVRVLGSEGEQRRATWRGTRRLLALTVPSPHKHVVGRLDNASKLALGHNPHGSVPALLADCVDAALDSLLERHGGPARRCGVRPAARGGARAAARDDVRRRGRRRGRARARARRAGRVSGAAPPPVLPSYVDVREQLARLVGPGFVTATGTARLPDLRRYLRAVLVRLDALPHGAARDQARLAEVQMVQAEVDGWLAQLPPDRRDDPAVLAVPWMVEELRVSLFAQQLGTPHPVSAKRIYKAMDALDG